MNHIQFKKILQEEGPQSSNLEFQEVTMKDYIWITGACLIRGGVYWKEGKEQLTLESASDEEIFEAGLTWIGGVMISEDFSSWTPFDGTEVEVEEIPQELQIKFSDLPLNPRTVQFLYAGNEEVFCARRVNKKDKQLSPRYYGKDLGSVLTKLMQTEF
jgi:hypothetical protein